MNHERSHGDPTSEGSAREDQISPLFSVIIPAYNAATVLPRSLASVSRQTFDDFEVVVVDDGSTDETTSVAESFGNEVSLRCVHQDNGGAATARNAGAAAAQGRYFLFLDADDEAEPEWLERLADCTAHAHPQVICCGLRVAQDSISSAGTVRRPRDLGPAFFGYRGLFLPGTYAIRRELFEAIGGFVDGLPPTSWCGMPSGFTMLPMPTWELMLSQS